MIDTRLREFATLRQGEVIDAVIRCGSHRKAAKELGISSKTVDARIREVKKKAARAGYSPDHGMTRPVPEGFHAKGVSTLYDGAGNVKAQWVKSQRDREYEHEVLVEAIQTIAEPFKGKSDAKKHSGCMTSATLLPVLCWGDVHLGMLSWGEETGEDFDIGIAEEIHHEAVSRLVDISPPCDQALIVSVGDLLHYDSMQARTAQSGHILDTDSRLAKIVRVAIRMIRWSIDRALERHKTVRFVYVPGNHDAVASIFLNEAIAAYYENDKRVSVDNSPNPFRYHKHGKTLLGFVHGDRTKPADLPGILAADRPEWWGQTTERVIICGHVHHDQVKEYPGARVETFRTLAPRDAWHNASGYRAGRDMKCIVFDAEYGEVVRHTVGVASLKRRAA